MIETRNPFELISVDLPENTMEKLEDDLASYWRFKDGVVLQISVKTRISGVLATARQRMADLLLRETFRTISAFESSIPSCDDVEGATVTDFDGWKTIYIYCVWKDVAALVTITGSVDDFEKDKDWALTAASTLRCVEH